MSRRWTVVWLITLTWLFAGLLGYGVAVNSLPVNAQAIPTPVNKPKTTILANTPYTLLLMKDNFTVFYWVDGKEHPAEYKQETLPGGVHYQFGLPISAWVAVVGRYPDGRWKLSVEPKTNEQAPGAQFAPVIGVTLVEPVESAPTPTSTPTLKPSPTGNPGPSVTSTVTPTKAPTVPVTPGRTPTPLPTGAINEGGNLCDPQPKPDYPHLITIAGSKSTFTSDFFWRCWTDTPPDVYFIVPQATFEAAWDAGPRDLVQQLRERMRTPVSK